MMSVLEYALDVNKSVDEILALCNEAKDYNFKSVCINPCFITTAKRALEGSDVLVCTVIGFPLGSMTTEAKILEAKNAIELGNLLEIQKKSYEWFITDGIKEVIDDIFPVESFTGNLSLEFGDYSFEEPRYSIKGCKERSCRCKT